MKLNEIVLNTNYRELDSHFYTDTKASPLNSPYLISFNSSTAELIELDVSECEHEDFIHFMNGSYMLSGSTPFAMCYTGYQFGHLVPRLGDGRALNLGKTNSWNLQLKGSGSTLYSRGGDGRAVIRSSIREYLISEAMFTLGVPTTRALAIIGSDENVPRARWEKGAIVLRMSSSWVRFGTFEYFFYNHKHELLAPLADYVIKESYPHLEGEVNRYYLMFKEIVSGTAKMIAHWQSLGFNHGVMNTDNMSIACVTIDYGPFAFLDAYDYRNVCNKSDEDGRYAFGNQPDVAHWNLSMLAKALTPILSIEQSEQLLENFEDIFDETYEALMCAKLGLYNKDEKDNKLIQYLLSVLNNRSIDYTAFFRLLSHYHGDRTTLLSMCALPKPLISWLDDYDQRLEKENTQNRHARMLRCNPKYILKNYILQEAIDKAEVGDNSLVNELLYIAQNPYDEHPKFERYAGIAPSKLGNLKLSCSS
jgi:serine/tyrosine/threonine adenylyltransferase